MTIKFPCKICTRSVAKNHRAINCDICHQWVHIKCNYLSDSTYKHLMESNETWFCIICSKELFPFSNITNMDLHLTLQGKHFSINSSPNDLNIDPSKQLSTLFENLNNISHDRYKI